MSWGRAAATRGPRRRVGAGAPPGRGRRLVRARPLISARVPPPSAAGLGRTDEQVQREMPTSGPAGPSSGPAAPGRPGRGRAAGGGSRPRPRGIAEAGRVHAVAVAEDGHDLRLVQGDPAADAVAERLGHDRGVVAEALGGVADRPAALVLQRLRQVPVVERGDRLDARARAARRPGAGSSPGPSG